MKLQAKLKLASWMLAGIFGAGRTARAPAAEMKQLAWLEGCWRQAPVAGQPTMEALMTSPKGGVILSTWKLLKGEALEFYELEEIRVDKDGRLVLTPFPFGNKGVSFTESEVTASKAVFTNPKNAFPSRIVYERTKSELTVTVSGKGEDGQPMSESFSMQPCR